MDLYLGRSQPLSPLSYHHHHWFLSVAVFSGGLTPALVWVGNSRLCLAGLNVLLEEHSVKFAISRSIALTCIILIYKSEPNGSRQHYLIRISWSAHKADPRSDNYNPGKISSAYLSIWNGCVFSDIRIFQSRHLFLISSLHLCWSCSTDFAVVRSSPSLLISWILLRAKVKSVWCSARHL